jgi:hypothetical protein
VADIAWDENGKPILLMDYGESNMTETYNLEVWTAQPDAGGAWVITPRYFASLPADQAQGSLADDLVPYAPGKMVGVLREYLSDKPSLDGYYLHRRTNLLCYDHGTWSVEYTGYDNAERLESPGGVVSLTPGTFRVFFPTNPPLLLGAWWAQWQPGVGLGEPEQIPGTAGLLSASIAPKYRAVASDGTMYLIYTDNLHIYKLLRIKPSGALDCIDMADVKPLYASSNPSSRYVHIIQGGAAFFFGYGVITDPPWNGGVVYESWRWTESTWIKEQVLDYTESRSMRVDCAAVDAQGHEYAVLEREWRTGDSPDRGVFSGWLTYFCTRLDPRIGP